MKDLTRQTASDAARSRLLSLPHEPLFLGSWNEVLMIHYEVQAAALQRIVPFGLDLRDGRAFVTLVAFRLVGMRPRGAGRVFSWLFRPDAFLNVRTYVRHQGEAGIFFLAEWLSSRLSVAFGPMVFGLPYRRGSLWYDHGGTGLTAARVLRGEIRAKRAQGELVYRALLEAAESRLCEPDSLEEWLMERYTAFTDRKGMRRFFRVWHEPWEQIAVRVEVSKQSLLGPWKFLRGAEIIGANFSPGLKDVWMGWPHPIRKDKCPEPLS